MHMNGDHLSLLNVYSEYKLNRKLKFSFSKYMYIPVFTSSCTKHNLQMEILHGVKVSLSVRQCSELLRTSGINSS